MTYQDQLTAERKYRSAAKIQYNHSDDVQIDTNAEVSLAENGAWVAAWVWVQKEGE